MMKNMIKTMLMTTIMTMCPGDHLDDENYDEYDDDDEYDDEDEYVDDINTLTPQSFGFTINSAEGFAQGRRSSCW